MSTLIHVVHPYTYKLVGNTFNLGRLPQFSKRDRLVGRFLHDALESRVHILHHSHKPLDTVGGALLKIAFHSDPAYASLLDPRIESIVTTQYGTPIPDKKPSQLSATEWKDLCETYISHSALRKKIGKPSISIYLGGLVEACLANTLGYHLEHFHENGTRLCYVPAFCVSFSTEDRKKVERRFEELGIETLSPRDALDLIHHLS